jgi:hypothetical protein
VSNANTKTWTADRDYVLTAINARYAASGVNVIVSTDPSMTNAILTAGAPVFFDSVIWSGQALGTGTANSVPTTFCSNIDFPVSKDRSLYVVSSGLTVLQLYLQIDTVAT